MRWRRWSGRRLQGRCQNSFRSSAHRRRNPNGTPASNAISTSETKKNSFYSSPFHMYMLLVGRKWHLVGRWFAFFSFLRFSRHKQRFLPRGNVSLNYFCTLSTWWCVNTVSKWFQVVQFFRFQLWQMSSLQGERKTYLEIRFWNCWSCINLLKLVVVLSENPKISISDHFGRVEIESGICDWCVSK